MPFERSVFGEGDAGVEKWDAGTCEEEHVAESGAVNRVVDAVVNMK